MTKGMASVVGTGQLVGTATNNNAPTGSIGEFVTATVASGSAVVLSTNTGKSVTSISLGAGDWDVSGVINYILTGVTGTLFQSGVSLTDNTLPTQAGGSGLGTDGVVNVPLVTTTLSATFGSAISPVRVSIAATTTIYLVAQETFSLGSATAFGTIRARRVR